MLLLAEGHGGEIGKGGEEPVVFEIEGFAGVVGDGPDGAAVELIDPGNEHAVGDFLGGDAEEVVVGLGDAIELRTLAVEAGAAGTEEARGGGVEVPGEAAGDGDPAKLLLAVGGLFFQRDAGTVGTAVADGDADEFLEDGFRLLGKDTGEAADGFDVLVGIAGAEFAGGEIGIREKVTELHASVGSYRRAVQRCS